MEREFLTLFGFNIEQVGQLVELVTEELQKSIQEETTINGIKSACLMRVIDRIGESSPEHYAAAGVMVEQAYNAAVYAAKNRKKAK